MPKSTIKHPRRSRRLQSLTTKSHRTSNCTCTNIAPSALQRILPKDIIGHILYGGYLDNTPQLTAIIRSVCHQFTSLATTFCTSLDAKPHFQRTKEKKLSIRAVSTIIKQFPSLKSVDFSHLGDAFTDKHLKVLAPLRGQLRTLKLRGTAVSDEGVMDYFGFTNSRKPFQLVPLEYLDLSKTLLKDRNKIGFRAMIAVEACCKDLKSLQVSMCRGVNDEVVVLSISKLKKLQELDLSMCSITTRGCCHIARLRNLRVIDITSALGVSGQSICSIVTGSIPSTYKDSKFDIEQDDDKNKYYTAQNEELSVFSPVQRKTSNLTVISAQFAMSGVDEHMFSILMKHAPKLKTLDLRNYDGIDISKNSSLSPLKLAIRDLERRGTNVMFSRARNT